VTTVASKTGIQFDRADFHIRPVTADDRAAIEAIAAQTWDGEDYLPYVFDSWLADKSGLFCAGVVGERVVAVAKLTHMGGDQWWMEGLRVDPAFQGLGLGRIMHHYVVNYSRRYAPGTLRFSTASENHAVIRMAAETAFRQVAAFVAYGAEADPAIPVDRLVRLEPGDIDRAWARLIRLPYFEAAQRSLEDGWRFLPLTPDRLRERLAAGQVYGWVRPGRMAALTGLAILNEPRGMTGEEPPSRLYVGYADAVPDEFAAFARALRGLAARQEGLERVSWKVLDDPELVARLKAAGYEQRWDMRVLLFARELSLTEHAMIRTQEGA